MLVPYSDSKKALIEEERREYEKMRDENARIVNQSMFELEGFLQMYEWKKKEHEQMVVELSQKYAKEKQEVKEKYDKLLRNLKRKREEKEEYVIKRPSQKRCLWVDLPYNAPPFVSNDDQSRMMYVGQVVPKDMTTEVHHPVLLRRMSCSMVGYISKCVQSFRLQIEDFLEMGETVEIQFQHCLNHHNHFVYEIRKTQYQVIDFRKMFVYEKSGYYIQKRLREAFPNVKISMGDCSIIMERM